MQHCLLNIEYIDITNGELRTQIGLDFDSNVTIELKTHSYSGENDRPRFYIYITRTKKGEYFQLYGENIKKLTLWFYKHKKPIVLTNEDGDTGKLNEKEFCLKIYNQLLDLQKAHI